MTSRDTGTTDPGTTGAGTGRGAGPRIRVTGDADDRALALVRSGVEAALDVPGLPAASGEVRVLRVPAAAPAPVWSATADVRLGDALLVVRARESSAHRLAERLGARLADQVSWAARRRAGTGRVPVCREPVAGTRHGPR